MNNPTTPPPPPTLDDLLAALASETQLTPAQVDQSYGDALRRAARKRYASTSFRVEIDEVEAARDRLIGLHQALLAALEAHISGSYEISGHPLALTITDISLRIRLDELVEAVGDAAQRLVATAEIYRRTEDQLHEQVAPAYVSLAVSSGRTAADNAIADVRRHDATSPMLGSEHQHLSGRPEPSPVHSDASRFSRSRYFATASEMARTLLSMADTLGLADEVVTETANRLRSAWSGAAADAALELLMSIADSFVDLGEEISTVGQALVRALEAVTEPEFRTGTADGESALLNWSIASARSDDAQRPRYLKEDPDWWSLDTGALSEHGDNSSGL